MKTTMWVRKKDSYGMLESDANSARVDNPSFVPCVGEFVEFSNCNSEDVFGEVVHVHHNFNSNKFHVITVSLAYDG